MIREPRFVKRLRESQHFLPGGPHAVFGCAQKIHRRSTHLQVVAELRVEPFLAHPPVALSASGKLIAHEMRVFVERGKRCRLRPHVSRFRRRPANEIRAHSFHQVPHTVDGFNRDTPEDVVRRVQIPCGLVEIRRHFLEPGSEIARASVLVGVLERNVAEESRAECLGVHRRLPFVELFLIHAVKRKTNRVLKQVVVSLSLWVQASYRELLQSLPETLIKCALPRKLGRRKVVEHLIEHRRLSGARIGIAMQAVLRRARRRETESREYELSGESGEVRCPRGLSSSDC